ncbi:MAG: DUF6756 family protein [Bacteroidia bacterium]
MWTDLRKEIEKIRKDFDLTDHQFKTLGLNDWQEIEEKVYRTFCKLTNNNSRPVWLWNSFKLDTFSISVEQKSFKYLDKLIDHGETIWFFVNESVKEADKFWFYQGQIKPIQKIIAEACYIDELYLVSKKYDWILCINHHDILIASGQTMPDKLRQLDL